MAVFGGSFNPPHIGHQLVTWWALESGEVSEVWWIPTYQHYFGKWLVDYSRRLAMCKLAVARFGAAVKVSTIERDMGGQSRTYNTLTQLRASHPRIHFRLLIGEDILREKDKWHRFDDVEKMAPLLVVGRREKGRVSSYPMQIPDISSTEIRQQLAETRAASGVLPYSVLDYILQHNLYT